MVMINWSAAQHLLGERYNMKTEAMISIHYNQRWKEKKLSK